MHANTICTARAGREVLMTTSDNSQDENNNELYSGKL